MLGCPLWFPSSGHGAQAHLVSAEGLFSLKKCGCSHCHVPMGAEEGELRQLAAGHEEPMEFGIWNSSSFVYTLRGWFRNQRWCWHLVSHCWVEIKGSMVASATSSVGSHILPLLWGIDNFSSDLAAYWEWEQDIKRTTWQNTWEAKGGDLAKLWSREVLYEGKQICRTLALLNVVSVVSTTFYKITFPKNCFSACFEVRIARESPKAHMRQLG